MEHTNPLDIDHSLSMLVNTSLVDVIAQKIRANIYSGKYEAGKKLIVRELAEEFDVSHTPIKDALNRLVAEGYVEAPPRKSMVVRTYSNASIMDSFHARLMCECFCAGDIIEAAGQHPEILAKLQEILDQMRKIAGEGEKMSYEAWVENETLFHGCYMRYCGNDQIYRFYQTMDINRACYFTYLDTNHSPLRRSVIESNLVEHQAIVDAIEDLDTEAFLRAVYCHIVRVAEDYAVDDVSRQRFARFQAYQEKYNV